MVAAGMAKLSIITLTPPTWNFPVSDQGLLVFSPRCDQGASMRKSLAHFMARAAERRTSSNLPSR